MRPHFPARLARSVAVCGAAAAIACAGRTVPPVPPRPPVSLTITGAYSIAPLTGFAALAGARFGGVSGLTYDAARQELIGICDDRQNARLFRMRIHAAPFAVEPIAAVPLETGGGAPAMLDAEGIVRLPDGHFVVSSEGIQSREPRLPPALIEYTAAGRFIRQLPVRPRYVPAATGPVTSGVRDNEAFESLTITPDGRRIYTATESPLVQDGPRADFDSGGMSRILEYQRQGDAYIPAREFAYPLDPVPRPSFTPGLAINGLAELLALGNGDLLSLERAFVENKDVRGTGLNRIRLYRIRFDGATDISKLDALATASGVRPVRKTLVSDLSNAPGLPDALRGLDNFEGLALMRPAGRRPLLLLVSDDNFSPTQRTWFVRAQLQ